MLERFSFPLVSSNPKENEVSLKGYLLRPPSDAYLRFMSDAGISIAWDQNTVQVEGVDYINTWHERVGVEDNGFRFKQYVTKGNAPLPSSEFLTCIKRKEWPVTHKQHDLVAHAPIVLLQLEVADRLPALAARTLEMPEDRVVFKDESSYMITVHGHIVAIMDNFTAELPKALSDPFTNQTSDWQIFDSLFRTPGFVPLGQQDPADTLTDRIINISNGIRTRAGMSPVDPLRATVQ